MKNEPLIHDKSDIINKFSLLVKHKLAIEANLSDDQENLSIVIVNVDANDNSIIFTLTCGTWELDMLSKRVLAVPSIAFSALFRDIQLSFSSKRIKKTTHAGESTFIMDIPGALYWKNRRSHSRKKIPIVNSSFCEVVLIAPAADATDELKQNYLEATNKIKQKLRKAATDEKTRQAPAGKNDLSANTIRLNLYDVSLSGCSMLNYDSEFSAFFQPGIRYENCKIVMADDAQLLVSFEIMTIRDIELPDAAFSELIGTKFLDIKRSMN